MTMLTEGVAAPLLTGHGNKTLPAQINNGECDLFVDRVMELCPEAGWGETDFETEPGHVYLTHEGRCYDAECPEGVTDYRDLPAIRR